MFLILVPRIGLMRALILGAAPAVAHFIFAFKCMRWPGTASGVVGSRGHEHEKSPGQRKAELRALA